MGVTTPFSFGYRGWGSAVAQLVEAVDAVEASRGCAPPLFVDVRISRSVRARGFDGPAFAHQVGASSIPLRDRWPLARSAATPWYSLIAVRADDAEAWPTWRLATGPAKFRSGRWVLPVCDAFDGEPDAGIHDAIERARRDQGYARRVSVADRGT